MKISAVGLLVIAFSLAGSSAAQQKEKEANKQRLPCWDKATSQLEMNTCAADEFDVADKEMNAVYKKVLAKFRDEPEQIAALKKAQRAWLEFRDAEVAALHPVGPEHGSIAPMCGSLEMAQLTRERTEQLKRALNNEEGDVCNPPGD